MKAKLFSYCLIIVLLGGVDRLYAISFRTSPQDTIQVTAEVGRKDSTFMTITKSTSGTYDSIVVDSLWYKSTGLFTGLYFGLSDSIGRGISLYYGSYTRGLSDTLLDSLSSIKYNVTFSPPAIGSYKDTLVILTKRYKNGFLGNEYDTLLVLGNGYQVYYLNRPDSVYFGSFQTGQADSIKTIVINTGRSGDTIVVDSIRFKSNYLDSTAYFSIRDSLGRRHSGQAYINKRLLPRPDSLKFYVRFQSPIPGWFADRVIIRYRILQQYSSRLYFDTLAVGAQATSPPYQNRYATFPDSFSLSAQIGQSDSSLGKIWDSGSSSDTVIVDSLRFKSTKNDTAAPFYAGDSLSIAFPDFINKRVNPSGLLDTLRFRVKFKPTVAGSFKDTLLVYYRIGSLSTYGRLDTILVKGTATSPPPQNHYALSPDSSVLSSQVGGIDSSFGRIWNTGISNDTVIVDSLRFKSTKNDTAAPFYISDSLSRAFPEYINIHVNPYWANLKFFVKFKPVSSGIFRDTVLIYYRFGASSIYSRMDTMWVRGTATPPPSPGYDSLRVSIPDTFLVGPKKFPGDTIILPVYMNSIRYNNSNGIYSFQMVLVYNDSLFQCLGYDSSGTVLSNRGGLTELTVQFKKDSGKGSALDTLRIAGASDDSLYYPEVPGTPFAFPRLLIKLKFRIPLTAHNGDSTILRFTRFMFNEGIPVSSTDDGSIKLKLRKKGDVDKNGIIQPYDAVLVLRNVIHDTTFDWESQQAAEVSGNGEITAYDASLILQYYVGKITIFPAGAYYKQSLPSNRRAELALEWGSVQGEIITVVMKAMDLTEVYGYSCDLAYDPAVMSFIGYHASDLTKSMTTIAKAEEGKLCIAAAGVTGLNGDGILTEFNFRINGDGNKDKIIEITKVVLNEELILSEAATISKPQTYALEQNYPNPFNPETRIRYQILEARQVQLIIYNLLGQPVRTLVNEMKPAGAYEVRWDGKNDQGINLASGIYIYRIKAGNFVSTRKLILMK